MKTSGQCPKCACTKLSERAAVGTYEAWVCSKCGLTEWYAKNVTEAFERALSLGRPVHVRVVERPAGTPFR